jgi:hypothetical protein
MVKRKKGGKVPSIMSEESAKPKRPKSPGKQKPPETVRSILRSRKY